MNARERIEEDVLAVLTNSAAFRAQMGKPGFPLDLWGLARHLGLSLEPQPNLSDPMGRRLLGGLLVGEGAGTVLYRPIPADPHRERWVIAHEIGHWVLHRDEPVDYFCTEQDMEAQEEDERSHWRREREANMFAAAVLMPAEELRDRYREWRGDPERLRAYFGVTLSALYWRMADLGLAPRWREPATAPFDSRGIRVLHFSDAHIGAEHVGRWPQHVREQRREDILRSLRLTVQAATAQQVDVLLFTGDAFQDRTPTNEDQKAFAQAIRPAIESGMQVVLLVGNHDRPANGWNAHSLWSYGEFASWFNWPNVHVVDKPTLLCLETPRGSLDIAAFPFVPPSTIHAVSPDMEPHIAVVDWAESEINRLVNERRPAVSGILAGHFSVTGAAVGGERKLMISAAQDLCLPSDILQVSAWQYVGLGHIHKPQSDGRIVYAGSLERVDFGEEGEEKGYVMVDVLQDESNWNFVPLPNLRPYKTLTVNLQGEDPTTEILDEVRRHDLNGALVRIQVEMPRSLCKMLQRRAIYDALEQSGALGWQPLDVRPVDPAPVDLVEQGTALQQLEGGRPLDALRVYLDILGGLSPSEVEALLHLAEEIEVDPWLHKQLEKLSQKEA